MEKSRNEIEPWQIQVKTTYRVEVSVTRFITYKDGSRAVQCLKSRDFEYMFPEDAYLKFEECTGEDLKP
jgi:hypothetical protein